MSTSDSMANSDADTTSHLETPIAPIEHHADKPAKKRIARMLALDVAQDASSMHCFPAQRKFKSARTLFEAEQCPEAVGRWLQGLEAKMQERQRNPQQRVSGQVQQWMTRWDRTSGHAPSDFQRSMPGSPLSLGIKS